MAALDSFVLVHSPLVGPLTWSLTAEALRGRGHAVILPDLHDEEGIGVPFWRQEAASVVTSLAGVAATSRLVLIGHSGAGPLLPAIGAGAGHPIAAYIFADAGLPLDGASRLDEMAITAPALAEDLRAHLAAGGRFPEWQEEDLREVVPDAKLRLRLVAELRPRALPFFTEPVPGFAGAPDAPCAYLQFGDTYEAAGARAQQLGWAYRQMAGGHFHMLVDPAGVANALLDLATSLPRR